LCSSECDELLVRSNDVFACTQCRAEPALYGIETADEFDDCIYIRSSQNIFNAISPGCGCGHKLRTCVLALALYVAVEDPRDLNLLVRSCRKNFSERTANCTKPKQTYAQAVLPFQTNECFGFIEAQYSILLGFASHAAKLSHAFSASILRIGILR